MQLRPGAATSGVPISHDEPDHSTTARAEPDHSTTTTAEGREAEGFATPEGIQVGSDREAVLAAYGEHLLAEEPFEAGVRLIVDDLAQPGQEITAESRLYAFDLDQDGTVTGMRAGGFPWLLGCAAAASPSPGPGLSSLTATFFGVGQVPLGGTVEEAANALGIEFGEVDFIEDGCGLARSANDELGLVVAEPGGVQAVVVATDQIPFVSGGEPVGVGDTEQDVRNSMPQWTGGDDEISLADGDRIVVTPREIDGYALLLETDPEGVIVQYRVGVDDYVLQVDYC